MSKRRFFATVGTFLGIAILSSSTLMAAVPDKDSDATAAFARLKTLTGQWEATSDKGKVTSSIELVSNGTALLEKINVPGEGEMVTVYYLEGNRLVLTHYCSAGNQPHMKAASFDPNSGQIRFDFAGATNLASAGDAHMHAATFKVLGPDAFSANWTLYKDGKAAFNVPLTFHRVR